MGRLVCARPHRASPRHREEGRRDAYRSNDYSLVLQAALDGEGVALGWLHIVSDLVAAGRLATLGDPVETDEPFRILTRPTTAVRPAVEAMQEWLCAKMSGGF